MTGKDPKTICTNWYLYGTCKKQSECNFCHSLSESGMPIPPTTSKSCRLCRSFLEGVPCTFSGCHFAHALNELNMPEVPSDPKGKDITFCTHWLILGVCQFKDTCPFAHGAKNLSVKPPSQLATKFCLNWIKGTCKFTANQCNFAHALIENPGTSSTSSSASSSHQGTKKGHGSKDQGNQGHQPGPVPGQSPFLPSVYTDPNAGYAQPTTGYSQPPAGYSQPTTGYAHPPAGYAQPPPPAGYSQQPPTGYAQQPPAGYAQQPPPAGYSQQPPTGYAQQPTTGYAQQPPTGYSQPPTSGHPSGFAQPPPTARPTGYYQPPIAQNPSDLAFAHNLEMEKLKLIQSLIQIVKTFVGELGLELSISSLNSTFSQDEARQAAQQFRQACEGLIKIIRTHLNISTPQNFLSIPVSLEPIHKRLIPDQKQKISWAVEKLRKFGNIGSHHQEVPHFFTTSDMIDLLFSLISLMEVAKFPQKYLVV